MKAVLFDLDGTLLDIDINAFIRTYFGALAPVVATVVNTTPQEGIAAVVRATDAMLAPHPGATNEQVFAESFAAITQTDLGPEHWAHFDRFYAEVFPTLRGDNGPCAGAAQAVAAARASGLACALATNPIFPRAAIHERLRWAGFSADEFDFISTYEVMTATKPQAAYFTEVADALGVLPGECLMVGDDPDLDLGAAAAGMRTFYVGAEPGQVADYVGTLFDVAELLSAVKS